MRKFISIGFYLIVSLFWLGCGSLAPNPKRPLARVSSSVEFRVFGGSEMSAVQGAQIILVTGRGAVEVLGHTDYSGSASIPKKKLTTGRVILFCREGYFCGAFKLYDKEEEYLRYDELVIVLAPFTLL